MIKIISLKRDVARAEIRLQNEKAAVRDRFMLLRGVVFKRLSSPKALLASFVCGYCLAAIGRVRLTIGGVARSTLSMMARQGLSVFIFPALYSAIKGCHRR